MISLFHKFSSSRQNVTLSLREVSRSTVWGLNLDIFNKPELVESIQPLKKQLLKVNITYSPDTDPNIKDLLEHFKTSGAGGLRKNEIVTLLASFAADLDNIFNLAKATEPTMIDLWQQLIYRLEMPYMDALALLGRKITIGKSPGWNTLFLNEAMLIPAAAVTSGGSYYWSSSFKMEHMQFFLSQAVRKQAAKHLLGEEALKPVFLDKLPEDAAKLTIENYEPVMASDLAYLDAMNSTTSLCGATETVAQNKLNSLEKKFHTSEFLEYGKPGIPGRVRLLGTAYVLMLLYNRKHSEAYNPSDIQSFARFVALQLRHELVGPAFQTFLPAFKGFNKSWSADNRANLIGRQIWELIKPANGSDGWLDMSNFILRYMCEDNMISSASAYTALFAPSALRRHTLRREADNLGNSDRSQGIDLWNELTKPFIPAYLRMLCACGIIELAVDNSPEGLAKFSGIRYVRLTPLGRFAFHLNDEYKTIAPVKEMSAFDIDDENMIITILQNNSPYEPFLSKIGRSIGGNRYRISPQTIISASSDRVDAMRNIDRFRSTVCPKPTGVWKKLIDEAKQRADCQIHNRRTYILVELNPAVPGLIDFIVRNEEISTNVIKAEGARILVPQDFYDRLRALARSAGYLL